MAQAIDYRLLFGWLVASGCTLVLLIELLLCRLAGPSIFALYCFCIWLLAQSFSVVLQQTPQTPQTPQADRQVSLAGGHTTFAGLVKDLLSRA